MERTKKRMNNKGFSLVELLIAIAIASIVGGAVFGFMRVGARTFSFNSADVNLQSESQLAFNQMQDLIIDTAVGIQYFAKTGTGFDEDSSDLRRVSSDSEISSTEDKLLRLYNVEDVYDIWWDRDEEKLYYNEWKADGASDIKKPINLSDASAPHNELMSEYITDFNVDLSRLAQRVVRIDFKYEKGDRIQAYSHNITLRNQIVSGNTIEERLRDAFRVSENVVPDSIKGKDIIYAEPGDTVDLTIVKDDGATGLEGYHVYEADGVTEIETSGPDAKETLHYGFATTSGHKAGYTTVGYSSGLLYIHPTETIGEFKVQVYCQSNNAVAKIVLVRVVRTTSISINFIAGDGKNNELDNGASGDDVYADDLKADETFKLQATPSISWTESATPAAEMSPDDRTKLQTIESSIKSGIYFKGLTGYPSLFKATGSLNSGVNPCEFKMMNNLTFGVGEAEYYTSPISARAICGYSESKSLDVHKDWEGTAYKKKADFTINYKNNIQRGAPQYIYKTTNTFTCDKHPAPGGFWSNHVQLLEVEAIERDYSKLNEDGSPTLRNMDREEYIRNFTVSSGSEGNTITWKCPVEWRLDCEYEFTFTMHIAHAKNPGDATKGIYVLPYGDYTKSDYEYTSNTTPPVVFHRFSLSYKEKENYNNIDIEENAKVPMDSENYVDEGNHVIYYARNFQEYAPRGTKRLGYYELANNIYIQEYANYNAFPKKGEVNNVYIDRKDKIKYAWDGGKYYVIEQFETKNEFPDDGKAGQIYFSKVGYERIYSLAIVEGDSKDKFPKKGEKFNKIYYAKDTAKKYIWDGENYYACEYTSKEEFPYKTKDGTFLSGYIYIITKSGEYDHEIYRITDRGEYYLYKNDWTDDPITLPISLNNEFTWRTDVWKALIESKSSENSSGKWKVYKPIYGSDGSFTWEEYTGRNIVCDYDMDKNNIPKNKIMFKYFTSQNDGGYLDLSLYKDFINKDIPARLRIYPFISWVGSNHQSDDGVNYETRDYVIDNNYVECVFWNIKIPYKSKLGDLYKATGWGSSYDISYFPGPDEPNFPGAKSTATRWYCAGYGDDAKYITTTADDGGEFYDLRYTLTEVSNYNAPSAWKLKLMYQAGGFEYEDLATYMYNSRTKMWELVTQ